MPSKASSNPDQDLIEAIAKLLNEQNLAEIEIEREDLRVRVTRTYATQAVQQVAVPAYAPPPPQALPPVPPPAGGHAGGTTTTTTTSTNEDLASNPGTLTSPMVGTAYLSPEPGKPAFASVGTKVSEGQTILIIEAMKTMNQIPAHRGGTVARILVEDGQPIEYGQPLAVIE